MGRFTGIVECVEALFSHPVIFILRLSVTMMILLRILSGPAAVLAEFQTVTGDSILFSFNAQTEKQGGMHTQNIQPVTLCLTGLFFKNAAYSLSSMP